MQDEFNFKKQYQDDTTLYKIDKDKYPYKAGHRGIRTSIVSAEDINKKLLEFVLCNAFFKISSINTINNKRINI